MTDPGPLSALDLGKLEPGKGRAYAPIVWLALASHLRWGTDDRRVWPSNARLAHVTGLAVRCVELGIAHLRKHGRIEVGRGVRACKWGRVISMVFAGPAPKVELPAPKEVALMWSRLRATRDRPAAAFALALAAHVHARAEGKIKRRRACKRTMAALARLVGAARGWSFNRRLADLVSAGVLEQLGETWRAGFAVVSLVVARLRIAASEPARLPSPPLRTCRVVPESERLAEMSEAFARLYA